MLAQLGADGPLSVGDDDPDCRRGGGISGAAHLLYRPRLCRYAIERGSDPDREPPFFFQNRTDATRNVSIGKVANHPYPSLTKSYHHEIEPMALLASGNIIHSGTPANVSPATKGDVLLCKLEALPDISISSCDAG